MNLFKKITAAFTACVTAFSAASAFPASAADEIKYDILFNYAGLIRNVVNIQAVDENGNPFESSEFKLIDSDDVCHGYFNGSFCDGYTINNSPEKIIKPSRQDSEIFRSTWDFVEELLPENSAIQKLKSLDRYYYDIENATTFYPNVDKYLRVYYYSKNEPTDFKADANTFIFMSDPAYAQKKFQGYLELNDTKYYFKDVLTQPGGILKVNMDKISGSPMFGGSSTWGGSASSVTGISISSKETEYVKCRLRMSDINENFDNSGNYILKAEDSGADNDIVFDLSEQDKPDKGYAMMVVSGCIAQAVVPDEQGYIEFYADKSTHEFKYLINLDYTYEADGKYHSTSRRDGETTLMCDSKVIKVASPAFSESGTTLMYVPAGKYTIKPVQLPEGYEMPENAEIEVKNTDDVQNYVIKLSPKGPEKDPEQDPELPQMPEDAVTVYPHSNYVNFVVENEKGESIPSVNMELLSADKKIDDIFKSDGSEFSHAGQSITRRFMRNGTIKNLYVPFNTLQKAAGVPDVFSYSVVGEKTFNSYSTEIGIEPGGWKDTLVYSKDPDEKSLVTIPENTVGVYVDPNWVTTVGRDAFIRLNDEVIDINQSKNREDYGSINLYSVEEYTSLPTFGTYIKENGDQPGGNSFNKPSVSSSKEYVLRRMKLSDLCSSFRSDGRFTDGDYVMDLHNLSSDSWAMAIVVSGGMINAVMPDKDGYVTFYAEKEKCIYMLETAYSHATRYGTSFGGKAQRGVAADSTPVTFCTPQLPENGMILYGVPEGEYTLKLSGIPDIYSQTDDVKVTIKQQDEMQTVKIVLEDSYISGDVNMNGKIDINDASLALMEYAKEAAGVTTGRLLYVQWLAADMNGDKKISLADATIILKLYAEQGAES